MEVIGTVTELRQLIKDQGLSPVGFVPTMGALHDGHISLVRHAIELCPVVVVSIFVNPTQFNDKNDLKNYPRTLQADLTLLDKALRRTDLVFTPAVNEIYPVEDKREFHVGNLGLVMEALHRPGHFNGVAQVVSRLFDIVNPDIVIFGQKDFQQLAVIRSLVKQTGRKVTIVGHPIIRETDGLAMSSRNRLLESGVRKNAPAIYETISSASGMIREHDIPAIKSFVAEKINSLPGFCIEYFEIVDDTELIPVRSKAEMEKNRRYYGCIAVQAGKIRLIDNIEIQLY
jgi:pantoate--beta-alanine ligase